MSERVDILMATYNGAKYLSEQIESILDQTYSRCHLYIRDDGSSDKTVEIVQTFIDRYPTQITCIPNIYRKGVKANFSALMSHVSAPYVMFCDQDDVWLSHKVEKTLSKMKELESSHPFQPCLIHTDLKVVKQNLEVVSPSFWNYTQLIPYKSQTLNRLLMQNVVTGCSMMLNRQLLELAHPIPEETLMHDWWIALVAAAFGKIAIVEEPTLLYRQHADNTLGAKKFRSLAKIKEGVKKLTSFDVRRYQQAHAFLERYQDRLEIQKKELLMAFLQLEKDTIIKSRFRMLRYGFFKNGFLRNLATFFLARKI